MAAVALGVTVAVVVALCNDCPAGFKKLASTGRCQFSLQTALGVGGAAGVGLKRSSTTLDKVLVDTERADTGQLIGGILGLDGQDLYDLASLEVALDVEGAVRCCVKTHCECGGGEDRKNVVMC